MLEENDLLAIAELIDSRISKSENLLLDEIVRTQKYIDESIKEVQKNLDELKQYYRITKLENDNTTLLLQMVAELQKRVADLEKKTA